MIEKKIVQIVIENINMPKSMETIGLDMKLSDIGINSITFIKIIVAIENEFDIEFSDEDLNCDKFPDLECLISYVKNKIS